MVALMGYTLVVGLSADVQKHVDDALVLLNIKSPSPPPPIHPKVKVDPHQARASGKASPRNLRQKATEVVAPKIPKPLPVPPPVVAAPVPNRGAAAASGASNVRGPGQGAGGEGYGPGSGGYGEGEGEGGEPPQQVAGRLRMKDVPRELIEYGTTRRVAVEYHVTARGDVDACHVTGPSGNPGLDRLTCRLIEERFRFRPSLDEEGRPVGSFVDEDHSWIFDAPRDRPEDVSSR
jgi:protein TonB